MGPKPRISLENCRKVLALSQEGKAKREKSLLEWAAVKELSVTS